MPFYRPTREEIRRRVQSDFRAAFKNDAVLIQGTIEHAFCEAIVGVSHAAHGRLDQVYRDAFPHLASEPAIIKWAAFYGMFRNRASYATGIMGFNGEGGAEIPTGTIVARTDGAEFRVTEGGTIDEGTIELPVKARVPGAGGNTVAGVEMALQSTLDGVFPAVLVLAPGLSGGADAETAAALRTRLLELLAEPESGGGPGDYIRWAKLVTGVTRVWEYGKVPSIGHVTVLFMRDLDTVGDDPDPFPDDLELATVKAKIREFCPIHLSDETLHVLKPIDLPIELEIELTVEDGQVLEDVKAAIIKSIQDMLATRIHLAAVDGGQTLYRSWISEAISTAPGEKDHKLIVPADDIVLDQWQLPTLLDPATQITWP